MGSILCTCWGRKREERIVKSHSRAQTSAEFRAKGNPAGLKTLTIDVELSSTESNVTDGVMSGDSSLPNPLFS